MKSMKNERGSVLVFATLMIVLLLVMVGIGLDTGWITYVRGLGQPAVDAAALAGASALPTGDVNIVNTRVAAFNLTNDYAQSGGNPIKTDGTNVTLVTWDPVSGSIDKAPSIGASNGVRVALEQTNPYGGSPNNSINAPLFLTPLFNVLGASMPKTSNISVSAVAINQGIPGIPIAISGCPPVDAATSCDSYDSNGAMGCKLAQSPSPSKTGGENSGWTTFTKDFVKATSAAALKEMINNPATCNGKIPAVSVTTPICLQNGVDASVLSELRDFYTNNGGTPAGISGASTPAYANDCGVIPVVSDTVTSFNHCDEPITKFAYLCIRDVVSTGSPKYVLGDITCLDTKGLYDPTKSACAIQRLVRDKKSGM